MADMNIQRDAHVITGEGELGRVKHVIVDHQTKEVTDLVIGEEGREVIIPMSAVANVEGDRVMLRGNRSQYVSGGRFDMSHYHPIDEQTVRHDTERTAERGGAPLVNADKNEVEIAGRQQGQSGTRREETGGVRHETSAGERPYRLQLHEEQLRANTVREQAGEVQVGKKVVEHQETLQVPVTEERVVIERTAATGQTPARGGIGQGEKTIDVPVMKERVNVEKEAVVTEEVNVRKEAVQHTEQVQGTVRKEELDVRDQGGVVRDQNKETRR